MPRASDFLVLSGDLFVTGLAMALKQPWERSVAPSIWTKIKRRRELDLVGYELCQGPIRGHQGDFEVSRTEESVTV